MSQLKRKSPDASPDANGDGRDDAPSKRIRSEAISRQRGDEHTKADPLEESGSEGKEGTKDVSPKREILSPPARRHMSPSPKEKRRTHDSRRRDSHSPPRRSNRRDSEVSRRESVTGPDKHRSDPFVFLQEEKKRGKRLFGGLLSTLSQTTSNSQQKRRQEVEKRQQERAAKQRIEDDKRRSERLARLDKIRRIEQVRFDEQVMRTRHANMRSMAHSLQSRTEPKLYYRPWQLTPEQEDVIKDQIRDAQTQIEDELRRFERHRGQRLKELGVLTSSKSQVDASAGEEVEDRSNMAAQDESATAATATNDRKASPIPAQEPRNHSHEDKDHDEMVEAEEDTVIY